jgi:hypothetical protein
MLIMDGHGSHLTMEFIDYCWDHKIVPFKLIAHATHFLQPYDVGFFQPMKQHHQNILVDQVRFGGSDYSKNISSILTMKSLCVQRKCIRLSMLLPKQVFGHSILLLY